MYLFLDPYRFFKQNCKSCLGMRTGMEVKNFHGRNGKYTRNNPRGSGRTKLKPVPKQKLMEQKKGEC